MTGVRPLKRVVAFADHVDLATGEITRVNHLECGHMVIVIGEARKKRRCNKCPTYEPGQSNGQESSR